MFLIDSAPLRARLTEAFAGEDLAANVASVLGFAGWQIGQPARLDQMADWLAQPKGLLALALYYFARRYPEAEVREIEGAASLVYVHTTDAAWAGLGAETTPLFVYAENLALLALGGEMQGERVERLPSAGDVERAGMFVFNLIEALYFKAHPTRAILAEVGEVAALLSQTRKDFKSKQVAEARERLEGLGHGW